jgi:hypothetical protein
MWFSIQLEPQPTEVTNLIDHETLHESENYQIIFLLMK